MENTTNKIITYIKDKSYTTEKLKKHNEKDTFNICGINSISAPEHVK